MKVTTCGDEVRLKPCGICLEPWRSLSIQGGKGRNQEKEGGTAVQGDRVHDRAFSSRDLDYEAWAIIS
jgi:hypothetical protein